MFKGRVFALFIMLFLNSTVSKAEVVNTYDELIQTYKNGSTECELDINSDLNANEELGVPAGDNVVINGHDHSICAQGEVSGIVIRGNKSLNADSITFENFSTNENGAVLKNESCNDVCINNGNFYSNRAGVDGGAIFNSSSISCVQGNFTSNISGLNGGAIYNDMGANIGVVEGVFADNISETSTGGAIFNFGNIDKINADFSGNRAERGNGGALVNFGSIGEIKGNFENNFAGSSDLLMFNHPYFDYVNQNNKDTSANMMGGGGAIMNYSYIDKLSGKFLNNSTYGLGGAIRNSYGTINMVSDEEEIYFSGNTDNTGSNAIYNEGGIINMTAGDYDITFNDKISGAKMGVEPEININKDGAGIGNININNEISGNIVNVYNGTVKFGEFEGNEGNLTDTAELNYYGGVLDLRSTSIRNTNLGHLKLFNNLDLKLDGSFEDLIIDTITADSFEANGFNIDISDIKLWSITDEKKFSVSPIGENMDEQVKELLKESIIYTAGDVINSPIYRYNTSYDPETGLITFERIENDKYNPSVYASVIASQIGGYLQQLDTYYDVFRRMNTYMLLPKSKRLALKYQNKYAEADKTKYLTYNDNPYSNKTGWISPYSVFENVGLKNGPRVSNIGYGTLGGIESEMIELPHNWDFIGGVYIGYNGSHQAYSGVGINQNGGTIGALAMTYKDNFFSGLTANVGMNGCEADTMYGRENFGMLLSGIASYSGYNFEFQDGRYIIQPNYLMSYSFIDTFSYNNKSGVKINTKPLNAIQIAPGVQFIGNFENGWQPYIGVNMVWNILDKAQFKANDVSLPSLSVRPFVMYGAGVRKIFSDNFSGFLQTYITNGGRNGAGIQFGLRWKI